MAYYDMVLQAAEYLRCCMPAVPRVGLVLGSGLGDLVDAMQERKAVPYSEIPNFPQSNVEGHAGNLVFGRVGGTPMVAMQGRFHFYEGFSMREVVFPIYVMKLLGVQDVVITNACGGISRGVAPGDLMLIDDFINTTSMNPLQGANDERLGPRFPDMTEPFSLALQKRAMETAQRLGIQYRRGVYALFQGPYYETRAEIRAMERMGADAVGMSTVPEVIAANHAGMRALGIACITNLATGIAAEKHSHAQVLQKANEAGQNLQRWLKALLENWE